MAHEGLEGAAGAALGLRPVGVPRAQPRPRWNTSFFRETLWATGSLPSAWYLAFLCVMASARGVRYLGSRRSPLRTQVGIYLLAPLYGLLYLLVLMPIRIWALVNLRAPGWGTRQKVEVRWSPAETSSV